MSVATAINLTFAHLEEEPKVVAVTPIDTLLNQMHRKNHPAWSRQLWNRKGRTGLSIPSPVVDTDRLQKGSLVGLVVTSVKKTYLYTLEPTDENARGLIGKLGPCMVVAARLKATNYTLYLTLPSDVIGFSHLTPADAVILVMAQKNLYRILTLDDMESHDG